MSNVILLNADYTFLNIIDFKKAAKLIIKQKVEIVQNSTLEYVNTVTNVFTIPNVIRLINLVKSVYKRNVIYSKNNVFLRDNFTCAYCGNIFDKSKLTIDHIIPKSRGGKSSYLNCITACKRCNLEKGNREVRDFRPLYFRPFEPTLYDLTLAKVKHTKYYNIIKDILKV